MSSSPNSHLSQDTNKHFPANGELPNAELWKQIIGEVQPKLVLTTGTAGGIGKQFEVGDVVVSPVVRFDTQNWLKNAPFANAHYASHAAKTTFFSQAKRPLQGQRLATAARQHPAAGNHRGRARRVFPSRSSRPTSSASTHPTTISSSRGSETRRRWATPCSAWSPSRSASAPPWLAIRNVSDPEIAAEGTLKQQAQEAATIYKAYGRWSSVCSAIVCWAAVAAL